MPLIPEEDFQIGEIKQFDVPEYAPPSFTDIVAASFRQENSLASWAANGGTFTQQPPAQEGYDPFDMDGVSDIEGYDMYAESFATSMSPEQTMMIKQQIDQETEDRKIINDGGVTAFFAQIAAGVTDPIFLPFMLSPVGMGAKGASVLKSAATVGAASGFGETAAELAKHASQEVRTIEDSIGNIAGATILTGVVGGMLKNVENNAIKSISTKVEDNLYAKDGAESLAFNGADDVTTPGSVGAAKTKAIEAEYLDIESAGGLEKLPVSPIIRTMTSPSVETKSIVQQMMETPVITKGEKAGIATAPAEGSVETRIKSYNYNLFSGFKSVKDSYLEYRGKKSSVMGDLSAKMETVTGQRGEKLSRAEFNEGIAKAMRRGDKSEIPEVQAAAEKLRREVFDPIKEKAIEENLLDADVIVKGSESYLTRMYNTQKIVENRHQWNKILTDWLERDAVKAAEKQGKILERRQAEGRSIEEVSTEYFKAEDKAVRAKLRKEMQMSARRQNMTDAEPYSQMQGKVEDLNAKISEIKKQESQHNAQISVAKDSQTLKQIAERLQDLKRDRIDLEQQLYKTKTVFNQVKRAREQDLSLSTRASASEHNLLSIANSITDKILGNSAGRLDYDISPTVKGPLKERTLSISDELIEDFLVNDIESIMTQYVKTMSPDIELKRMFGNIDLSDQIEAIKREYAKGRKAISDPKQLDKHETRMRNDIRDIEAMRDRIRGTYKMPSDPNSAIFRIGQSLMGWNFVRMLGGMTLSSIPDAGRIVARNGLAGTAKGVASLTNWKEFKMSKAEVQKSSIGLEMVLNSRASTLNDLTDLYARGTKFEKGLRVMTDTFGKVSLQTQWNDSLKIFAGVMAQDRFVVDAIKWSDGTLSKARRARLASAGISEDMAGAIAEQFKKHGSTEGLNRPNVDKWDDEIARDAFKMALLKDVDATIMTPGAGVKPLWTSTGMGKLMFQFKTFAAESHHKVLLADLQFRDAAALTNLLVMTALGTMAYAAKQHARGAEVDTDPAKLVVEGLDNSGVMGYFWDVNNTIEQLTRGTVGVSPLIGESTMSRYASRNWYGAIMGPSLGTLTEAGVSISAVSSGDISESDVRAIRKLLPYQNLFYIRRLLDELEKPAAQAVAK